MLKQLAHCLWRCFYITDESVLILFIVTSSFRLFLSFPFDIVLDVVYSFFLKFCIFNRGINYTCSSVSSDEF